MTGPLADRIRPETLEDFVGQSHLIAPGKLLYNLIHAGKISNMIFFGPSGTGKTTMANIFHGKKELRRCPFCSEHSFAVHKHGFKV